MLSKTGVMWVAAALGLAVAPASADTDADIRANLGKVLPGYEISAIAETPVEGLYEVTMGPKVVYVSGDGRYLMQGRLIDLVNREDLTEPRRTAARKEAVDQIGEENMVIFAPEEYDHTVTVFTDVDCGYCRKLHREMDAYGEEGIRVRYLFYPRAGVGSPSYDEAVAVWCADDRQQAMTEAKAGKKHDKASCGNPVKAHMALGEQLEIRGTPAIVLDNGDLIPGYVPAKRLATALSQSGG